MFIALVLGEVSGAFAYLYLVLFLFGFTVTAVVVNMCVTVCLRHCVMLDSMMTNTNRFAMYSTVVLKPFDFTLALSYVISYSLLRSTGYKENDDDNLDDSIDTRMTFTTETVWLYRGIYSIPFPPLHIIHHITHFLTLILPIRPWFLPYPQVTSTLMPLSIFFVAHYLISQFLLDGKAARNLVEKGNTNDPDEPRPEGGGEDGALDTKNPIVSGSTEEAARPSDIDNQRNTLRNTVVALNDDANEVMKRLIDPSFDIVMHLNEMETLALTRPSVDTQRTLDHLLQSNAVNIVMGLMATGFTLGLFIWCLSNDVTGLTDLQALLVCFVVALFTFELLRTNPILELRKMPTPRCTEISKRALANRDYVFSRLRELLVAVGGKRDAVPPPVTCGDDVSEYKKYPYVITYIFGSVIIAHIIAMIEYASGHV